MSERGAWIVVFLVWLFGSVVFGWLVDKISAMSVRADTSGKQKKKVGGSDSGKVFKCER